MNATPNNCTNKNHSSVGQYNITAEINEMIEKQWLSVLECNELFGISVSTIKDRCVKEKYKTRKVKSVGGSKYEIYLTSILENLKPKEKAHWQRRIDTEYISKTKTANEREKELLHDAYAKAPEYNRKLYDKYLRILEACEELRDKELKEFSIRWNTINPDIKTSVQSIRRIRKQLNEEGYLALFGNYGKNKGKTKVADEDFEFYKSLRLTQGQSSALSCWYKVLAWARDNNEEIDPTQYPRVGSFERRLKNEISEPARHLATKGYKSYNKKFNNYLSRTYDDLLAGQCWISDHRQLDIATFNKLPERAQESVTEWVDNNSNAIVEKRGKQKPVFPWLTAWIDFKSGKWLGWYLHADAPNTDHILYSFMLAAQEYGIPEEIYIDNGKDYRALNFAGGRKNNKNKFNHDKIRSLCQTLEIKTNFSLPYRAQSKTIERTFKTLKEHFDKLFPSYRGGNVVERPEILANEIKKGNVPLLGEASTLLDSYITKVMNNQIGYGKVLKGRSRNQVWNVDRKTVEVQGLKDPLRIVSDADLKMFMLRTSKPKKVGRNGICLSRKDDLYYWSNELHGLKGRPVYTRINYKKCQTAYVFSATDDSLICEASLEAWKVPALVKTNLDRKLLSKLIKDQRELEKFDKAAGITNHRISVKEQLELHAKGEQLISGIDNEAEKFNPKGSQVIVKTMMSEHARAIEAKKTGTDDLEYYHEVNEEQEQEWPDPMIDD